MMNKGFKITYRLLVGLCFAYAATYASAVNALQVPESRTSVYDPGEWYGAQQNRSQNTVFRALRHSQYESSNDEPRQAKPYRSKGEIVREVKQRYDAKVLKITLNREHAVYQVRVLMPNGRVRNLQLSAAR